MPGRAGAANLEINLKEVKAEPKRRLIIKKEIMIILTCVILSEEKNLARMRASETSSEILRALPSG
ncbi:MAG: hypothetical protein ACD_38C00105G0001 [uncultured bacterium]|nr:MAG: hypothetical protein ACD_38C00105G0001 [uncultured bacterium]